MLFSIVLVVLLLFCGTIVELTEANPPLHMVVGTPS